MTCAHEGAAELTVCPCGMVVAPSRPAKPAAKKAASPRRGEATLGAAKKGLDLEAIPADQWEPAMVRVYGTPVTQGHKKVVNGRPVDSNAKELKAWRSTVAQAALDMGARPIAPHVPVRLDVVFWLPRPASVSETKRPLPSTKKADIDTALRALCDGIDSILISDDAQITTVVAQKRYADEDNPPGASIFVTLDTGDQVAAAHE